LGKSTVSNMIVWKGVSYWRKSYYKQRSNHVWVSFCCSFCYILKL